MVKYDKKAKEMGIDDMFSFKRGGKEPITKKMLIDFFYDLEFKSASNIAEFFGGIEFFFGDWNGHIDSDETIHLNFYSKNGLNSVTDYFTSRNLEVPPSYDHKAFIQLKMYRILQITLEVSFKTWDNLFISSLGHTKDQNEFKAFLSERLRLCFTLEAKEYCSGFNININFV